MRRRRQKNTLLMRSMVISVLVTMVLLVVLAQFGTFKKIQEHFTQATMVVLPPPPEVKKEPVVQKKAPVAPKRTAAVRKGPASPVHTHGSNTQHVHVATATGPGSGDSGPGIDAGTLPPGVVPKDPADTGPKKTEATPATTMPDKPVVEAKPPPPTPPVVVKTEPKKEEQTPVAPPPPVVHEPVFTQAAPLEGHQPQPTIPDDLRSDALDKTFVAEVTVGPDGMPNSVMVSQSTGSNELDRLAMDTAKQWRFKPATRDGQPVESRVRLHIEFQVN